MKPISYMEHHYEGPAYVVVTLVFAMFASILNNLEIYVRIAAALMAMLSGGMAIRYYHYATKEKKQTLKNTKSTP